MTLDNIIEEIKKSNTIVILTHESPDGDAVRKLTCNVSSTKTNGKRSRFSYTRASKGI